MNIDQVTALLRILLAAGGPIAGLMTNAGLQEGTVNNLLTVALIVLPPLISAAWEWKRNTDRGKVTAAAAVPGVQVHVDTSYASPADTSLVNAALDRAVKDVVPMVGPPRQDTSKAG